MKTTLRLGIKPDMSALEYNRVALALQFHSDDRHCYELPSILESKYLHITYEIIPWNKVLPETYGLHLEKKMPSSYSTQKFIKMCKKNWPLSSVLGQINPINVLNLHFFDTC